MQTSRTPVGCSWSKLSVRGTVAFEVAQLARLTPDVDARARIRRDHVTGHHHAEPLARRAAAPVRLRYTPDRTRKLIDTVPFAHAALQSSS